MSELAWASSGDAAAVADHLARAIRAGARHLALPGGKTPAPILSDLAGRDLPWSEVVVRPTDERVVPADHPASNHAALAASLSGTGAQILPLTEQWEPRRFDLVWIGMGGDGHIASIFPNMAIAPEEPPAVRRATPDPLPPEAPFERLTLNYAALMHTDEMILVVRGRDKKDVLEAAIAGSNDLPIARLLLARGASVTVFWSEQ